MGVATNVYFAGRRRYKKRMADAEKKLRKEMRRKLRAAAKVTQTRIRGEISARGWKRKAEKTKLRVFVSRFKAWAKVYPGKKSGKHLHIHEKGAVVRRRGPTLKTGGRGKASVARYKAQPTYVPGVRRSQHEAVRIIGRSFKVV